MVYSFEIKPDLIEKIKKIRKKDKILFQRIQKKIQEIIENPNHYKPLRYDMKNIKSVHLDPFVITFSVNEKVKLVEFLEIDHHDKIYRRKSS